MKKSYHQKLSIWILVHAEYRSLIKELQLYIFDQK